MADVSTLNNNPLTWLEETYLPQYQHLTRKTWNSLEEVQDLEVFEANGIPTHYSEKLLVCERNIAMYAAVAVALIGVSFFFFAVMHQLVQSEANRLSAFRIGTACGAAGIIPLAISLIWRIELNYLKGKKLTDDDITKLEKTALEHYISTEEWLQRRVEQLNKDIAEYDSMQPKKQIDQRVRDALFKESNTCQTWVDKLAQAKAAFIQNMVINSVAGEVNELSEQK